MPDLDGIEATRDIKTAHPLVEVILLTGHASMEASLEGMRMGAFDYLLKPVNIDELVYKIEDASRKKQLQEEKIRRLEGRADTAASNEETTE
jgi:DNA-binding NtrC family response regulator